MELVQGLTIQDDFEVNKNLKIDKKLANVKKYSKIGESYMCMQKDCEKPKGKR